MKKEREQSFITYNHRILWQAGEKNLQLVTSSSGDAMFLFFVAFEGYLNWLGSRIAPEVWEEERQFFSCSPFQGTLGKYRFLAKLLCLPNPDPSQGPYQTAKDLLKLRDMVAHPKAEAGERVVKFKEEYFPPYYQSELEKKVSPDAAIRAKDHLEKLAEGLHRKAKQVYSSNIHESKAFGRTLGTELTDI